jgi:hypothetical protein
MMETMAEAAPFAIPPIRTITAPRLTNTVIRT